MKRPNIEEIEMLAKRSNDSEWCEDSPAAQQVVLRTPDLIAYVKYLEQQAIDVQVARQKHVAELEREIRALRQMSITREEPSDVNHDDCG